MTSRDRVQGLQGRAGSGKTSVLESIRQGAEQSGYVVEGFAPTSRAAKQLRDAGIKADTLQRFIARGGLQAASDPASKHFYMVDESSLASTQQVRAFLNKIAPQDKVLLIGDTRQHQGVDAGKPFEQLQEAGMRTAQLDQIVRQKPNPELLKVVEHLSNNETAIGVQMLEQQGRITEIVDPQRRIEAIAKSYTTRPENTLIVSPDNASRRAINQAVRQELQAVGVVDTKDHAMRVLAPRNDMTGADQGVGEPLSNWRRFALHPWKQGAWHRAKKLCPGRRHKPERESCHRTEAGRPAGYLRPFTSARHRRVP